MLRSYSGKLTARENKRTDEEAAALQGYFSQMLHPETCFLCLVMRPKLLQVINNFQKWESYLSVNTFKNYSNVVLWVLLKIIIIISYPCLVTENQGQLAGEKTLQEGHDYKKTKDFANCSIPNHGAELREGVRPSSVELCDSCSWNWLLHIACYNFFLHLIRFSQTSAACTVSLSLLTLNMQHSASWLQKLLPVIWQCSMGREI